jgi:hypothetical protein
MIVYILKLVSRKIIQRNCSSQGLPKESFEKEKKYAKRSCKE